MEFKIKTKQFEEELSRIVGVTGKQAPTSYARIEANGALKLSGTDHRERLDAIVEGAEISSPGLVCLPAKRLYELTKAFKSDDTLLIREKSDGKVEIKQGKSKFNLATISPGAFPQAADEFDSEVYIIPSAGALRKMIRLTAGFIGEDDSRFSFSGAEISFNGFELRLVASDSVRLAYAEKKLSGYISTENKFEKTLRVLVPQKSLQLLLKLLSSVEESEPVAISLAPNAAGIPTKIRFSVGTRKLTASLTSGTFPQYGAMLSVPHKYTVETNLGEFSAALKRLRQVLDERTNLAKFEFGRQALRFSSVARDIGDGFEEVPIIHTGDEKPSQLITIGGNLEFFTDFLSAARDIAPRQDAKVSISYSGPEGVVELGIPGASETFRYVLGAMRIPD